MLEFYAADFVRSMGLLREIQRIAENNEIAGKEESGLARLAEIEGICTRYEIDVSGCVGRIRTKITNPESLTTSLAALILELRHRIGDDLSNRLFMFIPTADAEFYDHAALFGSEIRERFPKANREITEAGNCLATGNPTACVFHLMRAVELGARAMVKGLNVKSLLVDRNGNQIPIELCDWGTLISALDKGVAQLSAGTRTSLSKKKQFEFYNHVVGSFRNFKDAWRNHVSHTREFYQSGQTKDIMDNTRQFMQHLATRLKE